MEIGHQKGFETTVSQLGSPISKKEIAAGKEVEHFKCLVC